MQWSNITISQSSFPHFNVTLKCHGWHSIPLSYPVPVSNLDIPRTIYLNDVALCGLCFFKLLNYYSRICLLNCSLVFVLFCVFLSCFVRHGLEYWASLLAHLSYSHYSPLPRREARAQGSNWEHKLTSGDKGQDSNIMCPQFAAVLLIVVSEPCAAKRWQAISAAVLKFKLGPFQNLVSRYNGRKAEEGGKGGRE